MAARAFDPYAALGIPAGASRDHAARAHRRLAKQFHPDVNPGRAAAERMRRINEAWRILSDPVRRSRHDAARVASWPGTGSTATGGGSWRGSAYGPGTTAATWTTWPESRVSRRPRRPSRPEPTEPSFGDRPAVFVAVWLLMGFLVFFGTFLGSVAP